MTTREPLYRPTLDEIRDRSSGSVTAIAREVPADLDTPVSAYLKLRGTSPSFLLESAEGGERIGRYSFIGSNPRRVLRVKDGLSHFDGEEPQPCADPLDAVRAMLEPYGESPAAPTPFEGGALGYLAYEAARSFERLPAARNDPLNLPDAAFLDVDTLLIFDHIGRRARVVSHVWPDDPVEEAYAAAVARIEKIVERLAAPLPPAPPPPLGRGEPWSNVGQERFEEMVGAGKEHIAAGNILQVVLSQRLSVALPGDPFGLYRRLRVISPSPYMYYLDFGDFQIVGASPELLVEVKRRAITARPIAGTRRRGGTPEEDDRLAAELLGDEKERAEHLMLVDLARNDVGRVSVAGSVTVRTFMQVERFSHVMHLVSDVDGRLRPDRTAYDALRAAFPAGTVSGAPKIRAMQVIAEQEPDRRGPYAGAVGFVNTAGDLEMCITIRTAIIKNGVLHLQVGAGIVADSVPNQEWEETLNKARAILEAVGVAG